ncbi:MAG: translocation/assembly module TamB domain-containing protein [Alphaproteobacteria bacterium]
MLSRLIIWVLGPVLGLIWALSLIIVIALRTDAGRHAVLSYALPELQAATGLKVEYKDAGGPWPNRFIFHGLKLSDDEGIWLTADYFAIEWSPWRLLTGQLIFPSAEIDNGYLRREPVIHETGAPSKPSVGPGLFIRIRTLNAKRFHLGPELIDQELMLDLQGGFTLKNRHDLKVEINADVDTPADFSPHLRKLFGAGLKLEGTVEGNVHEALAISGLKAQTRDQRLAFQGEGNYVIHTHALSADLTAAAAPDLAGWITRDLSTKSPIALHATLTGPFRNQSIKATAAFRDAGYGGTALPAFVASADILRVHGNIAGPVAIAFVDEANKPTGKAAAKLDYDKSGRVKLSDFALDYKGTSVRGSLDLVTDPDTTGVAAFTTVIPEASTLPFKLGAKGDLKASGQIRFAPNATSLDVQANSDHLALSGVDIKALAVTIQGKLSSLAITATAKSIAPPAVGMLDNAKVVATLGFAKDATTIRVSKLTTGYADKELALAAPANLTIAENRLSLDKLDVNWGEDGHFTGMTESNGDDLRLLLKIAKFNPPQGPTRIDGVIDVDTKRTNPGMINLSFVPTSALKTKVKMVIGGKWDKKRLALVASFQGIEEESAFRRVAPATFSMPLALTPGKGLSLSTDGPIEGRIAYGGSIAPFVALVPMPQQTLSGSATINTTVSGTLAAPVFAGAASLKDGKYQNVRRGVVLDEINLNGRVEHLAAGYVFSANLTASDGRKHSAGEIPISAKSEMTLGKNSKFAASLDLQHAQLVHLATATGIASGRLEVAGTLPALKGTGTINIESFDVNIPDAMPADIVRIKVVPVDAQGNPVSPQVLQPTEKDPYTLAIDCNVKAAGNINIRGRGLDSEWSADLHIGGDKDNPQISGALNLVRGRFDFSGRRFELTRGTIGFAPNNSFDPTLSIAAQYTDKAQNLDMINVNGPASQPKITLSSDPPQSQEDVMAMILFGKQTKDLSPFEAVQTANAVSKLTGKGLPGMAGMGILDRARSTLGLDLLNISLGAQGSVSVGKYIQKNIYVEASQGLAGQPGTVSVNVDISRSLSVKTSAGQDSTGTAGIFWKKDY